MIGLAEEPVTRRAHSGDSGPLLLLEGEKEGTCYSEEEEKAMASPATLQRKLKII